eukprot:1129107-Amphidinium_carterae.1
MSHGPSSGDIAVPEAERRSSRISGTLGGDVADAAAVDMEELEDEEEDEEEELVSHSRRRDLVPAISMAHQVNLSCQEIN